MDLATIVIAAMFLIFLALLGLSNNARLILADIIKHPTTSSTIERHGRSITITSVKEVER